MPKVREVFAWAYGPVPEGATCHALYLDFRGSLLSGPVIPDGQHVLHGYQGSYVLVALGKVDGPDISDRDAEAFRGFFDAAYDAALDALTKVQPDPRTVVALADVTVKDVFLKAYCGVGPEPDEMDCYVGAHDDPVYGLLPVPMMYCVIEEAMQDDRNTLEGEIVGHYFAWSGDDEGWVAEDAICASTMQTDEITSLPAYAFSPVFKCELYDKALRELTEQKAKDSIHPDEIIKIANALAKFVLEGTGTQGVTVKDFAGYYLKASGAYERVSADGKRPSPVLSTHLDVMGEKK